MANQEALACQLTAMSPAERENYEGLKERLRSSVKEVQELPGGYALRFDAEPSLILAAAEFITLESRCCPFYTFHMEVTENSGPMWLCITGPEEATSFIKDALGL
ncbi:MAG: hypothetical protein QM758_05080 [Armatimonas sp.]